MNLRAVAPVGLVLAGLLTLSACGSGSSAAVAVKPAAPVVAATATAAATVPGEVTKLALTTSATLGSIVTDQNGDTLYRFEKDPISPPSSNCVQQCALTWPAATVTSADVAVTGIDQSLIGTITRADGSKQLTIAGKPMYHYIQDKAPGDTKGQGVGQTWFATTATGGKASTVTNGATLSTTQNATLGTIVTDADGFTLYRFDLDSTHPSKSNCTGVCAKTWPPAVIPSGTKITLNGVNKKLVGTITRADGSKQITLGGSPLYEFSKDTAQGDVNGQRVKGTWFAAEPDGSRNKGPAPTPGATPATVPSATASAGSGY